MSTALQTVPKDYERKRYLGSSDIAGVMGISPWQTRVSVWQKKTDTEERTDKPGKKKVFQRGKVWEKVVAEMLVAELEANDHKVEVLSANKRYVHPKYDYMAAEIDYEIKLDDIPDVVNVELKTVHPFAARHWGESMTDEVPLWYAAQGMFGMAVTGRKCCVLAPLFGADEIRIFPIVRDEETIAGMILQAELFWNLFVIPKVPPEPLTLEDVNRLFKHDNETIVEATDEVMERVLRYHAVDSEIDARMAERDVLEFQVKAFMRDATLLKVPGAEKAMAEWKNRKTKWLDQERLKEAYPKLVREFQKEGTARIFKIIKGGLPA